MSENQSSQQNSELEDIEVLEIIDSQTSHDEDQSQDPESLSNNSHNNNNTNNNININNMNSNSNNNSNYNNNNIISNIRNDHGNSQDHDHLITNPLPLLITIKRMMLPLVGLSILVGIFCGLIIGCYMYIVRYIAFYSRYCYTILAKNLKFLPLAFVITISSCLFSGFLGHKFPEIKGSGIPYIESVARGSMKIRWYYALPFMILSSCITFFNGFALGPEGPAIYLGGCIGYGIGEILKLDEMHRMLIVAAGSSAGMSVAFNAPLSGLIFSIEEVYRKSSILIIIASILTVSASEIANHLVFTSTYLDIGQLIHERFSIIPFVIAVVTGILGGLAGTAFNWLLRHSVQGYKKIPFLKEWMFPAIPAIFTVIVGVWWPDAAYTGDDLMKLTLKNQLTIKHILITFVIKFVFILICFGSRISGGVLIPMFTIGALLGGIIAKICLLFGIDKNRFAYISLMTMSAFFTGVVRAPLTAAILPVEYTEQFSGWLGPITSVAFAYLVAELMRVKPLYEALMEVIKNGENAEEDQDPYNFIFTVHTRSVICGMRIREIILPESTTIMSLMRDSMPLIPSDDLKLLEGDELIIGSTTAYPDAVETQLSILF